MANTRKVKDQGKNTDVNGEGNEKVDNTTSTLADIATYSLQDNNPKVAGMANGYRSKPN